MVSVTGTLAPRLLMAFPVISQSPGIRPAALCTQTTHNTSSNTITSNDSSSHSSRNSRSSSDNRGNSNSSRNNSIILKTILEFKCTTAAATTMQLLKQFQKKDKKVTVINPPMAKSCQSLITPKKKLEWPSDVRSNQKKHLKSSRQIKTTALV